VLKAITLGLAVSAMVINMSLSGTPDSLFIMIPFLVITAINLIIAVQLLRNIVEKSKPTEKRRKAPKFIDGDIRRNVN
jgi:hypothetical protein